MSDGRITGNVRDTYRAGNRASRVGSTRSYFASRQDTFDEQMPKHLVDTRRVAIISSVFPTDKRPSIKFVTNYNFLYIYRQTFLELAISVKLFSVFRAKSH